MIAQDEIRRLMQQSGLTELRASVGNVPLMGTTYEGIFQGEQPCVKNCFFYQD